MTHRDIDPRAANDAAALAKLGYVQELMRRMSGFSNFALSLSIICIPSGCITSFGQGVCGVGGAAIGFGWPLGMLFALCVASTMGHIASAFPTAGGLYHWAAILGGRGWGWATAWFNLGGIITAVAAVNAGTVDFAASYLGYAPDGPTKVGILALVTLSQAAFNHFGIRFTSRITDLSGYVILFVTAGLVVAFALHGPQMEFARLATFANYSGEAGGDLLPASNSIPLLFALGLLLPAYTMSGYDASAHVAEETIGAAQHVPRAMLRAVLVSGLIGWLMLGTVVATVPDFAAVVKAGEGAFATAMRTTLPPTVAQCLFAGVVSVQYVCSLACITSASRMVYAFARDGGMPFSYVLRRVDRRFRAPTYAVWSSAVAAIALNAFVPYLAIAASCAVLLYVSYVIPIALGFLAYGRSWTRMGPWSLGRAYKPFAATAVTGCAGLLVIAIQPPNGDALWIVGGLAIALALCWPFVSRFFPGPPAALLERAGHLD
ncbi:MAG: amino acid permease [Gemmataceae bacterium]